MNKHLNFLRFFEQASSIHNFLRAALLLHITDLKDKAGL